MTARPPIEADQEQHLRGLSTESREALMVRAAKLYYDLERTQAEIGRELGLNRFQVARLLKEAREVGILRIEIVPRSYRRPELEVALQRRFSLAEAIVVAEGDTEAASLAAVADAAAVYLTGLSPSPRLIGVSWGRTMSAVAERLQSGWSEGVEVVLLNGATHLRSTGGPTNTVAERFAELGHGTATLLPAPAIVGLAATCAALSADPIIADVIARAEAAPVACFGLGSMATSSVLHISGYIDAGTLAALRARGAVGDILGHIIDAEGAIVDPELDARTIGLAPGRLRDKALSIGICTGTARHAIARAALNARYINVIITDEATAANALAGG